MDEWSPHESRELCKVRRQVLDGGSSPARFLLGPRQLGILEPRLYHQVRARPRWLGKPFARSRRGNLGLGKQAGLLASTDLKDAVRQFCYGWEGAGIPRLKVRYEPPTGITSCLRTRRTAMETMATGRAPRRLRVHRPASRPSSTWLMPPRLPGQGWCAAWVTNVFRAAGVAISAATPAICAGPGAIAPIGRSSRWA